MPFVTADFQQHFDGFVRFEAWQFSFQNRSRILGSSETETATSVEVFNSIVRKVPKAQSLPIWEKHTVYTDIRAVFGAGGKASTLIEQWLQRLYEGTIVSEFFVNFFISFSQIRCKNSNFACANNSDFILFSLKYFRRTTASSPYIFSGG